MRRRRLLAVGATAFATALAGCTGDGGGDGDAATTAGGDGGGGIYGGGGAAAETTETATGNDSATATDTGNATAADTTTGATTESGSGAGDATVVTVGAGGQMRFDPEEVTVGVGETVRWEWAAGGHNVRPESQPADADWSGTPGGDGETYDSGYTHEFTFEVPGRYEYYCAPTGRSAWSAPSSSRRSESRKERTE